MAQMKVVRAASGITELPARLRMRGTGTPYKWQNLYDMLSKMVEERSTGWSILVLPNKKEAVRAQSAVKNYVHRRGLDVDFATRTDTEYFSDTSKTALWVRLDR